MALYYFDLSRISRSKGRNSVASAAYRSGSRLHDDRLDRDHNYLSKADVIHSEVMLPEGAPERLADRATLWNEVESVEKRRDAVLAREVQLAIPRELTPQQGIALVRDFVATEFVARGMVADLNVHWDIRENGDANPHAHVMLATRLVGPDGFGLKELAWRRVGMLLHWRQAWADHVNTRLAELDIDARIDHRSLKAQGIDLEPQPKLGAAAAQRLERGLSSERADEIRAVAVRNGDRIIAHPELALDAITQQQSTFTRRDLAAFVHRNSDGQAQFEAVMAAVRASSDMILLGKDRQGEERFTARAMIETERRLEAASDRLAQGRGHALAKNPIVGVDRLLLQGDQGVALDHVVKADGLSIILGYAGTGKSTMLGHARAGWEQAGYRVQGLALSGIAAENLEKGSGIASRTIASLEHHWVQGREPLSHRDILIVDEAGMVGTRQMERLLSRASDAGAKVVLVGDPEQLQAIEAGAAFRMLAERHGTVEIRDVRRQRADWQREATRWLATGRTGQALHAYDGHQRVTAADTRETARTQLVEQWMRDRSVQPEDSRIILAHTRDEVRELNDLARGRLREAGQLGEDVAVKTARGARDLASGDRLLFLRNAHDLGIRNGSLGHVLAVTPERLAIRLDDGRELALDPKTYVDLDHGYATTIHKAQGMTVDYAHVLATPGLDRHASYVALTRHRDDVHIHYGRDDFADMGRLVRTLSRERAKDMAGDYLPPGQHDDPVRGFAERRGLARIIEQIRDIFAGFRARPLEALPLPEPQTQEQQMERAVERYARSRIDIGRMREVGLEPRPDQMRALERTREALEAIRPHATIDLDRALERRARWAETDASGPVLMRAMREERQLRTDPFRRADRFVEAWRQLQADRAQWERDGDLHAIRKVEDAMGRMARDLKNDRQVAALLLSGERSRRIDIAEVRAFEPGARSEREAPARNGGLDR